MMKRESNLTGFLALAVFGLFAVCLFLVLLAGADCYRTLTDRGAESYDRRTAARYLTTRVRQAYKVETGTFEGMETLILEETAESDGYLTQIYCYEGWLRELYAEETGSVTPADGEKILPARDLQLSRQEDLLLMGLTLPESDRVELALAIPAEEVVP